MKLYKILVVDDEAAILNILEEALRPEYEVLTAMNGQNALSIMEEKEDIALAISDQKMSGITGVELMEELTRKYPDTVRILITGYAEDDLFMNAINVGHIYGFITKPWDLNELKTVVRKGVRHYEKTQMLREPHVRSLLHSGILSVEQLESIVQATEDSKKSIGEILIDNGIILPNELNTAMMIGDSEQKDLAEVLIEREIVFESDLEIAREQQKQGQKNLTDTLVEMGYADEDTILTCYALHLEIPYVPLTQFPTRMHVAEMLPSKLAYEYAIVPVDAAGRTLVVATSEPLSEKVKAGIEAEIGRRVMTILSKRRDIEKSLRKYYPDESTVTAFQYGKPEEQTEGVGINAERT